MIDSGNLFADLISEKLANILRLPITGKIREVGTAAAAGQVTVLGRAKPFKMYLEGISEAVIVKPYVVKDLAHPINLGQEFLRTHQADMNFRQEGIQIRLKNSTSLLESSSVPLTKPTIDTRLQTVLSKLKEQGGNPSFENETVLDLRINNVDPHSEEVLGIDYNSTKRVILWGDTQTRIYNTQETLLPSCHDIIVKVERGRDGQPALQPKKQENSIFLSPKTNSKFLNDKKIFIHPGVYKREGNTIKIKITNYGKTDAYLPRGCTLGRIVEAEEYSAEINALDHRSPEELNELELIERRTYIIDMLKLDENPLLDGKTETKEEVIQIFLHNWAAVSIHDADYGKTNLMKFRIEIPAGTKPVRAKLRPLNPFQESDLRRQINDWLDADVIEPAISPWASALVPCKKKQSDKLRWALDYRKVNELTEKDAYPLASIEANLHKLSDSKFFSTLDSAGAFHAVSIQEEHRDYTAFNTPMGQYRFCRLPFGLANAPAAYSRLVQLALDRLPPGFALAYIDDVIIHSQSLEEHIEHIRQVVALHVQCGMKLNLRKCALIRTECEYLGHLVGTNGIRMIPSYVQRILDWPLPTSGKDLRSFLGFCGYYRSFIKDFADLTFEMNKMKTATTVDWDDNTTQKFNQLKECFKREPVRGYPQYLNPEPFILDTDFSATNMAAVLSQKQDGREVFLGCVAKKCNKAESGYPSHKGEMGAVILGLKKFEHILRAKPFVIRTDSQCVKYMQSVKEQRGIWARWACFLASFKFTIVHRAGTRQTNADALSRMPGIPENAIPDPLEPNEPFHDVDDIYHIAPALTTVISTLRLQQTTAEDPVLTQILPFVETQCKPSREERKQMFAEGMSYVNVFECLHVENKIIYYRAPQLNQDKPPPRRVCLPMSLYETAFRMCHADASGTSGHFGMNNTFRRMRERFYFPNMYSYIAARVNNCVPCITKRSTLPRAEHKQHREMLSYFNQRCYIDVIGPLTPAQYHGKTCKYILTIQDGFTRYLIATPIEDQTTNTIIRNLIEKWIHVHGVMETLHSDNGPNFTSNLFREVMHQLGVTKTYTPVYSPQGDRVERAHRVIGDLLRADNRFEARQWPQKLSAALLAYNVTVNRLTGMSPFEAVFGRPATLPVDLVFPFQRKEGVSWSTFVENFKLNFSQICARMCEAQRTGIMRDNARYQGRAPKPFKVGDFCYYFLARVKRGLTKKLSSRWIGPWKIQRVVSESLVVIYPAGNWCENPKEVAAIINRLRRVDPQLTLNAAHPGQHQRIDLDTISDELDEASEYLSYQEDFEGERNTSTPRVKLALPLIGRSVDTDDTEKTDTNIIPAGNDDDRVEPSEQVYQEAIANSSRLSTAGEQLTENETLRTEPTDQTEDSRSEPGTSGTWRNKGMKRIRQLPLREAVSLARFEIHRQLTNPYDRNKRDRKN